jgi:hypothetical protein
VIVVGDLQIGMALEGRHAGKQITMTQEDSLRRASGAAGVGESVDIIVCRLDLIQAHLVILPLRHQVFVVDEL